MSNRLPIIQSEVADLHRAVNAQLALAAEKALAAGAALVEAKSLCPHGTWAAWLAQTGIPERSAQRYMKLHRGGCIPAMVADLGMDRAERLSSLGLKLWPAGSGREIAGLDGKGAGFYALILPCTGGRALYWAAYTFSNKLQDFYFKEHCSRPVILGIFHEGIVDLLDVYREHEMSAEETCAAFAELKVAP